jgi:ATP-dependent helicase/DNAse subunit B
MVERFYTCPYLNYIENGLKVRPRQLYELKPNIIGSIIHDVIYEYFNAKIQKKKLTVDGAVERVFSDEKYAFYCTDKRNLPLTNALRKEAEFIIVQLEKNSADADLQPYAVEYKINRLLPNGYELHGRVDRVDRFVGESGTEYYAVFDYKTGTEEKNIPKKIYMGEKLQLPLYSAYFVGRHTNIAGAGYLPLAKGFAKGEKSIQLNGFVDEKSAVLFDRKIGTDGYRSKIINEKQRIDGGTIKKICDYADAMVVAAVDKISGGYIEPNPAGKNACKYCPVCSACPQCEIVRRGSVKVNYSSFGGGKDGK